MAADPASAGPPVEPRLAAAHAAYFERRDWAGALALWSAAEAERAPTLESRLALLHCRIELADPAALDTLALTEAPPAAGGWAEAYAHVIRARAFQLLNAGEAPRAARLTRLMAQVEPHLKALYDGAIDPAGDPTPIAAMRIDRDAPLPFERELRLDEAGARAILARHQGKRVLLAKRRFVDTGKAIVEHDLFRHFTESLESLGVALAVIDTHFMPMAQRPRFAPELRDLVDRFKPDLLSFDDMLISGVGADEALQPAILEVFDHARRAYGTRIVFDYCDAWYDGQEALMAAAADLPDLFLVHHPGLLSRLPPDLAAKTHAYPPPMTDWRDSPAPVAQKPRASFVGTINWASMSRLVWWTEIAAAGLPVDLYPTLNLSDRPPALYAHLLASHAMALNLTTRSNGRRILTGRTIEAPFYGSLLVEEHSADADWFLRPFDHYVPFDTLGELERRLAELLADEPLRARITRAGTEWVQAQFGGLPFWARLFWKLWDSGLAPATGRFAGGASGTLQIPTSSLAVFRAYQAARAGGAGQPPQSAAPQP